MRTFTSAEAKNNFGELIDLVRAAPVMVTNYDRPRVMVMASEGQSFIHILQPMHNSGLNLILPLKPFGMPLLGCG